MKDSPEGPRHKGNSLEGCEEENFPHEVDKTPSWVKSTQVP